jgi:hypothetical protein
MLCIPITAELSKPTELSKHASPMQKSWVFYNPEYMVSHRIL